MKKKLMIALALVLSLLLPCTVSADTTGSKSTGIKYQIRAIGQYANWDGVSNVSQFADADGSYCFAYDNSESVVIVRTKNGKPVKKTITLKKEYPLFGGVACDSDGYYYLVTGRENSTSDTEKDTIFISKYGKKGKLLKTVGDNGSSSLGYWYNSSFNTRVPFDGGNCDLAINGNYLVVHYAREMYSGHQSNSVLAVDITTMEKVNIGNIYSSHSFAQRAIPHGNGFILASEGDCYNRAFTVTTVSDTTWGTSRDNDIFHFWVEKGTFDRYDMFALNDNFAHMGGLVSVNESTAALVGTSAKSLSQKAASENEQLFIQIFDPSKPLDSASAYVTSGNRSGLSGNNGDEQVTDYGVKWLTSYSVNQRIACPQVATAGDGKIVILYELYKNNNYKGVYYMVLDQKGNIVTKKTRYSASARLNPCEMPVSSGNTIYWTGNAKNSAGDTMYIYSLTID